ncbi:MAG: hypothetical protein GKR89_18125 [Candidatus Latescibacteria bacterium]|nr:hypothetical protein [Candidatus Latescibacterota bacterium]
MKIENFEICNASTPPIQNSGGNIVITTSCGSMWGKGNTCENLLLCPPLQTDPSVELSVELRPQFNGEQAGIVLYKDSDNYIKFVREMVQNKQVVVLAKEIQGNPEPVLITDFEPSSVELHIDIKQTSLAIKWKSLEASDFHCQEYENWLGSGVEFNVGLLVHGNNSDNQAVFRSLKINGQHQ